MKTLLPFSHTHLQKQAKNFSRSLQKFINQHPELKSLIENYPIDHLAIKSYSTKDYESYLQSVVSESESLTYTPMDNRRIATAILKEPIIFKGFGSSNIFEIIEPKPEKTEKAAARFDHIEIHNPNFAAIETVLKQLGLKYQPYKNDNHQSLVIVINNQDQEIKFTNGHLEEIIQKELKTGSAKII